MERKKYITILLFFCTLLLLLLLFQVKLISGSLSALHHALITFAQLLRVFRSDEIRVPTSSSSSSHSGVVIPPLVITDFPSIPNRGFAMDMTPAGRIPTLVSCIFYGNNNKFFLYNQVIQF